MEQKALFGRLQGNALFSYLLVLTGYAAALLVFFLQKRPEDFPAVYEHSFFLVLGLSFLFSTLILFNERSSVISAILAARLLVLLIMSYPFQAALGFKVILFAGVLIETGYRLPHPRNAVVSVAIVFLASVFFLPNRFFGSTIWGMELAPVPLGDLVFFIFFLGLTGVLVCSSSYYLIRSRAGRRKADSLAGNIDRLMKVNVSFQQYAEHANEEAAEKERERITREIHDASGYIYTNLLALVEVAISIGRRDIDRVMETLFEIKEQAKEGLKETRIALRRLREVEEESRHGIKELIKVLKIFERVTGTTIDLELGNIRWVYGEGIDLTVYRIVQEALTNSIRHGHASRISIHFWETSEGLQISFRDNGRGAEKFEKGIGLTGMEERLRRYGGRLEASGSDEGFHLFIVIPVEQGRKEAVREAN